MATHHYPASTMDTDTAVRGGAEPIILFEDSWFFGNLFNQTPRPSTRTMSRCFSDPCTSSRTTFMEVNVPSSGVAEASPEVGLAGDSVPEMEEGGKRGKGRLMRQRSCKQRMSGGGDECGGSRRNLVRTPSLPPMTTVVFGGGGEAEDDDDDDESDVRMSHLIRTAFAQSSKSSVTPRSNNRPPRNTDHESNNPTPIPSPKESSTNPGLSPNPNPNPNPLMKSVSNLETLFSQSSLVSLPGSDLNSEALSRDALGSKAHPPPSCLQDKKRADHQQKGLIRRTQSTKVSSEDLAAASASAVRKWVRPDNSAEDLKAQIKLWARNVATNVRQEC